MQPNPFYTVIIDAAMRETGEAMFMTSTVRNLTFEGVKDPLIEAAEWGNLLLPFKYDKFGWFYAVKLTNSD